jgi:hypothetical protein
MNDLDGFKMSWVCSKWVDGRERAGKPRPYVNWF